MDKVIVAIKWNQIDVYIYVCPCATHVWMRGHFHMYNGRCRCDMRMDISKARANEEHRKSPECLKNPRTNSTRMAIIATQEEEKHVESTELPTRCRNRHAFQLIELKHGHSPAAPDATVASIMITFFEWIWGGRRKKCSYRYRARKEKQKGEYVKKR